MKQIIVMRKDLKMPQGKAIAQGAHASMKATLLHMDDPRVKEWLSGQFTKIAVGVNSEEELLQVYGAAKQAGLIAELITDSGLTVFNGVPTNTCIAVGPDTHENLQPITGHLKLL
jgi:peptidyl-tRNA hydrolase, PTH2 family